MDARVRFFIHISSTTPRFGNGPEEAWMPGWPAADGESRPTLGLVSGERCRSTGETLQTNEDKAAMREGLGIRHERPSEREVWLIVTNGKFWMNG